jgi:hypothetical protein
VVAAVQFVDSHMGCIANGAQDVFCFHTLAVL